MSEGKVEGGGSVHISPDWVYFAVFGALFVLTVLTWRVALEDFGAFNDVIALGIAFTKATLVVLFFMHVKYAPGIIKLIVVSSLAWLMIMFGLTLLDYQSRNSVVADPPDVPTAIEYGKTPKPPPAGSKDTAHAEGSH